ncbi:MAG: sulfurtransferase [Deltaproteobacteria bacterium]|nr:sulfurtransferase [Deltaproteobacteria bacterium]
MAYTKQLTAVPKGPLVDVAWVQRNLLARQLRLIDLRWYLQGPKGSEVFLQGHLPRARFVDLERDITSPVGPGRHPIPSPAQLTRAMRAAGVCRDSAVVVYDDAGGSVAARLWWLLRQHGHTKVRVLDGGIPQWLASGALLEPGPGPAVEPGDWTARLKWIRSVDKHFVQRNLEKKECLFVDARVPARFRGEVEPVDARPGHLPGAINAPWTDNLVDGRFADSVTLAARFKALGVYRRPWVVSYCGSGVTACHNILALERAGHQGAVFLYEGSWSDWARDPDRSAELGDARPRVGKRKAT